MLRRVLFSGIAAGAIVAVSLWVVARPSVVAQDAAASGPDTKSRSQVPAAGANRDKPSRERLLVQASPTAPLPGLRAAERREVASDLIVIPGGRLRLIDLEDVPSLRDGVLMFIGTEITDGRQVPTHEVIPVQMGKETKLFHRLKEGDYVQADQLVALVDDSLARADEAIKVAKVASAEADKVASEKTREEARARWDTQRRLWGGGRAAGSMPATSAEDLRGAELTYNKYVYETISKEEAIKVAKQELNQAEKTRSMYEIRPKISGIVKTINKHLGEAVKSLEPLLQIQNYESLRVDGWLQEQYANHLEKGMEVVIEPTFRESPKHTFTGHRRDVTGVAVSKDPQRPLIVSSSLDGTVRVWELAGNGRERVLKHPAPVKAVACTPFGASANLCLSGDEQGKARLWDLNDRTGDKPLGELKGQHGRAITCVAFSPDGKMCATGGDDREIMIWDTATGDRRYRISGHNTVVTALYFAPGSRLISVGHDFVLFWKLGADRAKALDNETIHRGRTYLVDNLGVSPDGKLIMDEHGTELRILSTPGGTTEAVLRIPAANFANFALFSPDGRLALTTTTSKDGVLQLWRIDKTRSSEMRQFIAPVRSAGAKSAAFAPDQSFVVGAVSDRVYVWPMPAKAELEQRITATITNVEKPIGVVENKVLVTAEFKNPGQRLRPNDVVNIVAYPQK